MYYVVRSLNMMHYLIRQGFDVQKVVDNKENDKWKVFLFTDSKELRQAMTDYNKQWEGGA